MVSGGRIRRRFVTSVAALLLCASAIAMQPAAAAPVTAGYRDFSYGSSVTAPTGQKPQSKLFFNDGSWWGVLFSTASDAFNVYELNSLTQEWSDTGVVVEPRNSAQLDVLFDGTKLYVASGNKTASASQPTELRRFTYSSASRTYTLDPGFPANIVSGGMESGVIDKDTTGKLWFTYTRDNSVYVTRTGADDTAWIAPYIVPTSGASGLQSEDQSAVVSYDGQIGVMWSNQNDDAMYFASHVDGAPDSAWVLNPAVQLPEYADDHLNVKSIQATNDGRVFAATKTSLNNGNAPLILLLELKQNGTWSRHNVWTVSDDLTRPMVLVDEENGKVFMFATGPCCSGGKVYMKEAPLSNVSFSGGLGTVFMESSQDPKINNVTSTKQPLNSTTGLVAIAGDDSTRFYLHNTLTLGPDTQPPETTLSSVPANPSGPGDGTFQFVSNENGSTFQCQLDGAPATPCTSPLTYPSLSLGSHTFSVAATDVASNTDPTPATYTWDVVPVSGATFTPTHDASAFEASPTTNNGSSIEVEVDGGSSSTEGMVQFNVTGVTGAISSATLRFFATNGTGNGPRILPSATNWDESTVNWNNRPAITGGVIVDTEALISDTWHEIDVTSAISGDGPVSFTFAPDSSDGLDFASSESSDPPELVITFESGPDNTPPETTITGGPNATTSATDATFTFISSEAGSTFECLLDNGGWNSCTSPQLYNNLSVASHTFDVRATDASANTDLTPASQTWVIEPDADPTVTSVSPANGATGVSATTSVDVVFSEAMDASTVNTSTVTLSTGGGAAISATVSYDAGTITATLDPASSLAALTTYDVSVQGATDSTGNTVVPFASSFTTGDTPSSVTLNPIDDARVFQNSANNNYGSDATLISDASARQDSYIKFDASAVGNTVSSAVLRVYLTNGSGNGPEVSLSDVAWSEGSITWNNRPATVSGTIADVGSVSSGAYIDYDVSAAVTGPGLYSFRFSSVSSDGTKFSSKEAGSNPPELVIQSNSGPDTTPPETVINSGPDSSTNATTAQFAFQSFEPGVTFECLLDGGSWAPCVSGIEYTGLAVGAHHFEVRATDAANNTDPTPATFDWTIVGGTTLIFTPAADTYLSENRSTTNYGSSSTLTSDGGNGVDKETLLRFDVTGVSTSVTSVKLRVWVTNSTSNGPEVFATNPSWVESAVTWSTKPALTSGALFDAGPIPTGAWYEFDLSGSITTNGTYSFTTISVSTDAVKFQSKEGSNAPQLVLTVS